MGAAGDASLGEAVLAAAGALEALSGHRRNALWDVSGIERMPPLLADLSIDDAPAPSFLSSAPQRIISERAN